jgi:hypothetical protein
METFDISEPERHAAGVSPPQDPHEVQQEPRVVDPRSRPSGMLCGMQRNVGQLRDWMKSKLRSFR